MHHPFKARPMARTGMLIRKPVAQVFDAFINPDITRKFWFTDSTGPLEAGQEREWTWSMYGLTVPVFVQKVEPSRKIVIDWGEGRDRTTAEWTFQELGDKGTYVEIINYGFQGSPDEILNQVSDSCGGFNLVLAGLKAYLEYDIQLNLVGDRFPKEIMEGL
jgi:uncharacterized protein YndB with AHSA1/START domain